MYDLAVKQRNTLPPDISKYIMKHHYVTAALRTARNLDTDKEGCRRFEESIINRK